MEVAIIILSLVLLIWFAYRGYSVIFFAPIFAVLAVKTREWVHSKDFLSPWAGFKALYGKPHDLARKDPP